MIASWNPIGANPSATVVITWTTTITSASIETLR